MIWLIDLLIDLIDWSVWRGWNIIIMCQVLPFSLLSGDLSNEGPNVKDQSKPHRRLPWRFISTSALCSAPATAQVNMHVIVTLWQLSWGRGIDDDYFDKSIQYTPRQSIICLETLEVHICTDMKLLLYTGFDWLVDRNSSYSGRNYRLRSFRGHGHRGPAE